MMRPMEVLKAIQVINAAKRRGASAPDSIIQQQTFINLTIPTNLIQKFQVSTNNHVVQAGDQTLITMQSGSLLKKVKGNSDDSTKSVAEEGRLLLSQG
jgi:rRNA pseudouridine-1189 N-methylase Emg1 (Nep1/Mra1 family)